MAQCLAVLFCHAASTFYHLYSALGEEMAAILLRIDLIGISIMIFVLTMTAVHAGYYSASDDRTKILGLMVIMALLNATMQLTPCYATNL